MARVCECCGKSTLSGHNVSHSERKTKRKWYPNLQRVRVLVNGTPKRMRVCTDCLRAGRVEKMVHAPTAATPEA